MARGQLLFTMDECSLLLKTIVVIKNIDIDWDIPLTALTIRNNQVGSDILGKNIKIDVHEKI